MALYHLSATTSSRRGGRSVIAAAAYRAGARLIDPAGLAWDYARKRGIDHSEVFLPEGANPLLADSQYLWTAVEEAETRVNARLAREFNFALPVELSTPDQIGLARAFAARLVAEGMCVDLNCHHLSSKNPHAHIMATTRLVAGSGFGAKERRWDLKSSLIEWRKALADLTNEYLANWAAGVHIPAPRVDHRSLEAQGIARAPQQRIKPGILGLAKRGFQWAIDFVRERRLPIPTANLNPAPVAPEVPHAKSAFQFLRNFLEDWASAEMGGVHGRLGGGCGGDGRHTTTPEDLVRGIALAGIGENAGRWLATRGGGKAQWPGVDHGLGGRASQVAMAGGSNIAGIMGENREGNEATSEHGLVRPAESLPRRTYR